MHALANLLNLRFLPGEHLRLSSLGVALAAFTCAFLVQTKQLELDYTYPLEALLKTILTDDVINEPLYKLKL